MSRGIDSGRRRGGPSRTGDTGTVADADGPAWTPDELTATPPAEGMVRVRWSDSTDPTQLYLEYATELRTVHAGG